MTAARGELAVGLSLNANELGELFLRRKAELFAHTFEPATRFTVRLSAALWGCHYLGGALVTKPLPAITTVDQLIRAYGGMADTARAFHTSVKSVRQWRQFGLPCTHYLGCYLGLLARGYLPTPSLFAVERFQQLAGFQC